MEYTYAQIQNGKVVAISTGPSLMILLENFNDKLSNTTYIGQTPPYAPAADFSGYRSVLTASKMDLAADGIDSVTINIAIKTWEGVAASTFNGAIKININGSRKDLTVTNGAASYVYKTTSIGIKSITTQDGDGYPYISHGSLSIEAYGNLEDL